MLIRELKLSKIVVKVELNKLSIFYELLYHTNMIY